MHRFPRGWAMTERVAIVIVSHSADVARGAAAMVRQMAGKEIKVAHCGGNPEGGLGTNFAAQLRLRVGNQGKWTDAKSVARVLALKAPKGQTLFFEAEGADAREALSGMTDLVRRNFDEGSQRERQFEGQVACAGLTDGYIVRRAPQHLNGLNGSKTTYPATERQFLESAVQKAALELERLKAAGGAVASEIIE